MYEQSADDQNNGGEADQGAAQDTEDAVDPETGKPIVRIYEDIDKHPDEPYVDARGRIVSRRPQNGQAALDNSVPKGGGDNRIGVEPGTGKNVILNRHSWIELPDRIEERYHGYVPEGA